MKLESGKMGDKSLNNQNDEADLSKIENGNLFREGADYTYSFTGDVTDACIDASRYVNPYGLRHSLSAEIINLVDGKANIQERLDIAKLDKKNVIAAYLVTYQHYTINDIYNLLVSEDEYLVSIGVGLAVINDNPLIIPRSNIEGLYKYFRSREIKSDQLIHFISDDFISCSFRRMLKEERVIFTWMINNLISLMDVDAISVDQNSDLFVSLLRDKDYLNETHMALFLLAIKKRPNLIEDILKLNLCIDPFTKQYNYPKWLKEVRKFFFISNLRDSLPEGYSSGETLLFDKRKSELYRINKNDRSLEM
ncbi:hypothetical protein [Rheinheimera sp. F8]|uniref:hypothetical protein n=1 Tax=Rheinheimera sp. F8 TaxID=1763998 RepID=UPI001AD814BC|nr:hypothetical protein [Rheinheimera sp. F8]